MAKTHDYARARLAYLQQEAAGLAVAIHNLRRHLVLVREIGPGAASLADQYQAQLDKERAA